MTTEIVRESEEELLARKKELVKKIKKYRARAIELVAELEQLRAIGHARAPGVEKRLNNVKAMLSRLYFYGVTGAELLNRNIGPADEPPEMWKKKTS